MSASRDRGSLLLRRGLFALAAVLFLAGASAARGATPTGPGRIAVTGAYPGGYVGLLTRYGLPHDILLDYQLADAALVCRYGLLIVAGPPRVAVAALLASLQSGAETPFQRFLEQGGSLLIDYGSANPTTWNILLGRGARFPGGGASASAPGGRFRTGRRFETAFRLVGGGENPLRADAGTHDSFSLSGGPRSSGEVPDLNTMRNSQVLAEYVAGSGGPALTAAFLPARLEPVATTAVGAQEPAIVLERVGKGKVLHCGPALATETGLASTDCDGLILGMVRVLTDGRAVPQIEPEGPRLGRRESTRTQAERAQQKQDPGAAPTRGQAEVGAAPNRPLGTGARGPVPAGFVGIEDEPAAEFTLSGRVGASAAQILLNYWSQSDALRVDLSAAGVRVARAEGRPTRVLAASKVPVAPGSQWILKERQERLLLYCGSTLVTATLQGAHAGRIAARGMRGDVRYQPVEAPSFSDDFMRTSDQNGGWETRGGEWATAPVENPDMGANPFSYKVAAKGTASALNGYPFWDEYRYSASVRADRPGGFVGLGFYAKDADNLLLFQAPVSTDGAFAGRFSLVRLVGGKPQLLAEAPGSLAPGQWYRFQVRVLGASIEAYLDGARVLTARDTTFTGGRIALRAENTQARFDDVSVEPASARDPGVQRLAGQVPAYAGVIDVDSWAGLATPWEADPAAAGLFWRRGPFFGDVSLRYDVPVLPSGARVALIVGADGASPESGGEASLARAGATASLELRLAGKVVARKALPAGKPLALELRREGARVVVLVDGKAALAATADLPGNRVAIRAAGFRPRLSALALTSAHLRDYTFDTAPVDWWVGSGEWDVTNRWSCTPDWSWFGGYSQDVAAIWHKRRLQGDTVLDFYVGPKMLSAGDLKAGTAVAEAAGRRAGGAADELGLVFPGGGPNQVEWLANFNAVLCGDAKDVRSGYSFVLCENGSGARILRNGVPVAECKEFRFFTQAHNRWASIRVEKQGARVALYVEGQQVLEYRDPNPLAGGYAGLWTQNNGIMLPRITLFYQDAEARILSMR